MPGYYPPPLTHIGGAQPLTPRKLAPSITAVEVDTPPYDQRQWFYRVVNIWNPGPPLPAQLPPLNPSLSAVRTDNPNPISWANLYLIARTWDAPQGPVLPPSSPPFTTGATVTVNEPPYDGRQWFFKVRSIWDIPPPLPTQLRPLNPQFEAVTVNNPIPQSIGQAFYTVLSVWNIPAPLTQQILNPQKSPITASVFSDAITEAGTATDAFTEQASFADSITEAGTATDTTGTAASGWSEETPASGIWTDQATNTGTWTKVNAPGGTWTKQ